MNRIVYAVSLIIGCFGQQDIAPTPNLNNAAAMTPPQNGMPILPPPSPAIPITTVSELIERPCRPSDLSCIRRYFQHNSKCKPAPGRVPDPLVRPIANKFYPRFNVTRIDVNDEYIGLNNGRIQEFYINRNTDKLVIGIELRDYLNSCKDVFFRYHRRAKEPIITHGFGSDLFSSLHLTVTIPQVENLRLDKSDSFGFSNNLPVVNIAPSLGQSSDPSIPVIFANLVANLPTDVTENLLTESSFLAATYIQYVICDFGLKLI